MTSLKRSLIVKALLLLILCLPITPVATHPVGNTLSTNANLSREKLAKFYQDVKTQAAYWTQKPIGARMNHRELSLGLYGYLLKNGYAQIWKDIPIKGKDDIPVVDFDDVARFNREFGNGAGRLATENAIGPYNRLIALRYWYLPVPGKDITYKIVADYPTADYTKPVWQVLAAYTNGLAECIDPDKTGTDVNKFTSYWINQSVK